VPGAAVVRKEKFEFQFARFVGNGIAKDDAVRGIPEDHGVEEGFGIRSGELRRPVLACVGGVVDAGLVARSGGHQEGFVDGEGYHGAEVECGGARDLRGLPGASSVDGAEIGAVGTGGPGDFLGDSADAAETFGRVGSQHFGRRLS